MEVIGFLCALLIGFSLGLIGGGGSILTLPVLVYIFGVNPVIATAYSLFIVGTTALVGSLTKIKQKLVDFKVVTFFAIPSFLSVYLTRRFLVPAIPETIFNIRSFTLSKELLIMLFFAIIMLGAAISMIKPQKLKNETHSGELKVFGIMLDGAVVGTLTGFVGAGGGFLIVPALVLLAKLPMKMAVGTSLVIVAIKSLVGFVGDLQSGNQIDWGFLLLFTSLAVVGIFAGSYTAKFLSDKKLKTLFGWFVLAMSMFILFKELI